MEKKTIFKGSGVALVTPFNGEAVDYEALKRLIEFQLENETDAIIVCGTTGEASTMTKEEKLKVIDFVVKKVNGKIPVIAGAGGNNTKEVISMCKDIEKLKADALLIVTPYYNKTTQSGLYEHYRCISQSVSLPIILYNVPSRTGLNMKPETVAKLNEIDNIVAIKEASGDISQIAEIASICDIDIYSGNDDQITPVLSLGGKGVISVLANAVPKDTHKIVKSFLEGDIVTSRNLQLKYLRLIKLLFCEVNPIPIKKALEFLDLSNSFVRLPLVEMTSENTEKLKAEMINLSLF